MTSGGRVGIEPLEWSQEILRELLANTQTGILLVDLHGSILEVNPALCALLGSSREAIVGEPLRRFVAPEDADAAAASLGELRTGARISYRSERKLRTAAGETVPARVSGSVVRAETGDFICALEFLHDLRPQLAAERRLRENEARYRSIVEHQTDLVIRWKGEGIRTFVNDAYCRHLGKSRAELLGTSFFPLFSANDLSALRAGIHALEPGSPPFVQRSRTSGPDRTPRWLEWTSLGIFDGSGALIEMQSVGRDITERVQMSEALSASEHRYRRLFNDLPIPVWAVDWSESVRILREREFDGPEEMARLARADPQWITAVVTSVRSLGANPAALRLFGAESSDQLSGTLRRLLGDDGVESTLRILEMVSPMLFDGQKSAVREVSGTGKDGAVRDVRIRWTLTTGAPAWRVIATAVDQSESRKLARQLERHRRLLEDAESIAGIGSWEWRAAEGVVRGSAELWKILEGSDSGRASRSVDELPGSIHPDDAATVAGAVALLALGQSTPEAEFRIVRPDGSIRVVRGRGFSTCDADGNVIAVRGILREVTEEKRAEESAEAQRQELVRADRMISLGVLVSGVAHEINNPNQFILLNAPLLGNAWRDLGPILEEIAADDDSGIQAGGLLLDEVRAEAPGLISDILEAATRTRAMVSDLREFARDSGPEVDATIFANDVVRSALRLAGRRIERTTDHFELHLADPDPPIRGSLQRLAQVVVNLILHACEATGSRDQAIEVSTTVNKDRAIEIRVRDGGRGMPAEQLLRASEPGSAPASPGLGLALSRRIVVEHGGQLTFESEAGRGTTATITIPIAEGS